jgi:hypothetical protein
MLQVMLPYSTAISVTIVAILMNLNRLETVVKNFLRIQIIFTCLFSILSFSCHASNNNITLPEAPKRTIIQNYKDMVLAFYIADAYHDDKLAAIDAGSSVSALIEWTYYNNMDKSIDEEIRIVDSYLSRNY